MHEREIILAAAWLRRRQEHCKRNESAQPKRSAKHVRGMDADMQRAKGAWIGRGVAEPGTGGEIGDCERQRGNERDAAWRGARARKPDKHNSQGRDYGEADPPDSPRMRLEQHGMH